MYRNQEEIFVDRKEEDKAVIEYQKTNDSKILNKIYTHRVPSLKNWANKHYFPELIAGNVDDLFSELTIVFLKAVRTYKKGKGSFNTWLFTCLLNRIKNIKNSRYAKKRTSDTYDGPLNAMVLSLDYMYDDTDNKSELHEILEDPKSNNNNPIELKETIGLLSKNNPKIEKYLLEIGKGNSVSSVIKSSKTKKGYLNLSQQECSKLKNQNSNELKKLIAQKIDQDFKLLDFQVKNKRVYYTVQLKKTKESEILEKEIKDIRRNKEFYCNMLDVNI